MLVACVVVAGPTSIAHTSIEPDSNKNWKVKYTPVEVGEYTITLLWNDVDVACEFQLASDTQIFYTVTVCVYLVWGGCWDCYGRSFCGSHALLLPTNCIETMIFNRYQHILHNIFILYC